MDIPSPEKFEFNPEHWLAWKFRFLRFQSAADLASKTEVRQVNTLIYSMGDRAEDIFNSFKLLDTNAAKFDIILDQFDKHFIARKNVIFERAKFNSRKQQPGESASSFITDLHKLAESWEYGDLRDELIRDRLVVGMLDAKVSKKLQMVASLTLEKVVTAIRQVEQVHSQQDVLRGAPNEIAEIKSRHQYNASIFDRPNE